MSLQTWKSDVWHSEPDWRFHFKTSLSLSLYISILPRPNEDGLQLKEDQPVSLTFKSMAMCQTCASFTGTWPAGRILSGSWEGKIDDPKCTVASGKWSMVGDCLLIYSFVHSFFHSFVHFRSFVRSFICSFVYSFIGSFVHSFIGSFVHSFVLSFVHLFIHSFSGWLTSAATNHREPKKTSQFFDKWKWTSQFQYRKLLPVFLSSP